MGLTDAGRTEYEALVRDARRYRWLRDHSDNREGHPFIARRNAYDTISAWTREYADEVVDAAMEAAK